MIDSDVSTSAPLTDLGLDSLSASSIRTWLMKELMVQITILKILSNSSIGDLAQEAFERLPRDFIPGIAFRTEV